MKLVLVGPPGCGKGTQAVLIREEYNVPQISTGDILRAAVREGSELGKKVGQLMNTGSLISDDIIIDVMKERIGKEDCRHGYILDGFPRTLGQARALDEMLGSKAEKLDAVISFEVSDEEVVKRLSGRRQCTKCGDGYHVEFKKPEKNGTCNKCGSSLYQREDDKEDTVRARLRVYRDQTEPLLNYYKKAGILKSVDGIGSIDEIFKKVSSLINNITPAN